MLEASINNRWDEVQRMEIIRENMLSSFFSTFIPENASESEQTLFREINDMNEQLLIEAGKVKAEFLQVIEGSANSNKAIKKYEQLQNMQLKGKFR